MPVTRRARTVDAAPERVWRVVSDPARLPRWWPRVRRVEAVTEEAFTIVMATAKGRLVRADQRVVESEAPVRRRWAQEVRDSPFERLLRRASTGVSLRELEDGTEVTLELEQRPRGLARFGGLLFRRAAARQLEEALDGLERVVG